MSRRKRPEYDSTEFLERWNSGETLRSLSKWLSVHESTVWQAAMRRGLACKNVIRSDMRGDT